MIFLIDLCEKVAKFGRKIEKVACFWRLRFNCVVLYCIVLYCIVLCYIVWYGMVLYCIVLYCIVTKKKEKKWLKRLFKFQIRKVLTQMVLYCIVLYCIVFVLFFSNFFRFFWCFFFFFSDNAIWFFWLISGEIWAENWKSGVFLEVTFELNCIVLYCIVLYCIMLYCIDCIVLYCIVLFCIVLYCIVLHLAN